jgi:UDP-glucose 4-epimerase
VKLIEMCAGFNIPNFVFFIVCMVYGNPDKIPVTESTAPKPLVAHGYTSTNGRNRSLMNLQANPTKCILLRYFNPVGAHQLH